MKRIIWFWAAITSLFFSASVFAQNGKEIDLRRSCEASMFGTEAVYYMIFLVRNANPSKGSAGHAYVQWVAEDDEERACVDERYGKAPQNSDGVKNIASILFKKVPGHIRREVGEADEKFIVRLNSADYRRALAIARKLNQSEGEDYRLVDADCVEFVKRMAKTIHMEVPEDRFQTNTLTPAQFLAAFIRLNDNKNGTSINLESHR